LQFGSSLRGIIYEREDAVLIGRCAWHRGYRGYPILSGITSWRGWSVRFTDGICGTCLARFRAEHQRYLKKRPDPEPIRMTATSASSEAAA
jgi:hypothetical protein